METDEDIFLVPTYTNLIANQREYPLHASLLSRIKRVEAKLDGTNYIKLKTFDLTEHSKPVTGESNITYYFANEENQAYYDIMRKSLWIYSGTITNVTDGLRVWVNTYPADLSSLAGATDMSVDPSTTTHGIPRELHKVICDGVVIEWKGSREKALPLTEREQKWEFDVEKAIQSLKKADYDRQVIGSVPYDDGSDY